MNTTLQISLTPEDLQLIVKNAVQDAVQVFLKSNQEEKYLTREEAANALSITMPTLHAYSLSGKIKAYRIGRKVRYKRSEIDSALQAFKL